MMIDTAKWQPLDYLLFTAFDFLGTAIRIREAGIWKAFDLSIATHAGIALPLPSGGFGVAEMLSNGLRIDPLTDYEHAGLMASRIVGVRRNPIYANQQITTSRVAQVWADYNRGLAYNFKGIEDYLLNIFPQINTNQEDYCSQLLQVYAEEDGSPIQTQKEPGGPDAITPRDIQTAPNLITI